MKDFIECAEYILDYAHRTKDKKLTSLEMDLVPSLNIFIFNDVGLLSLASRMKKEVKWSGHISIDDAETLLASAKQGDYISL